MKQSKKEGSPKKNFKSLKKMIEFFDKRLDLLVNNAIDRVRLPCPYSRVSELIILDKCISIKKKNAVNKLEILLDRQEKLAKQIKQETMDLKGIVGRQSRELVEGKVKNVKVLYESEIYLLNISVSHAQAQVENYIQCNEEVEEENKKCKYFYDCIFADVMEQKNLEKEIAQLQAQCDMFEVEISEIDMQLGYNKGGNNNGIYEDNEKCNSSNSNNENDDDNFDDNSNYNNRNNNNNNNYNRTSRANSSKNKSKNSSKNDSNYFGSVLGSTNNKNSDKNPEQTEANANVASLKTLPWLIHNIFNKLVNE